VRRAIAFVLAAGILLLPAAPAAADVSAEFALGILTVTGDRDGNAIVLECINGNLRVNDSAPTGGRVRCRDVQSILVRGGRGSDRIDLTDLGRNAFPVLLEIGVFGEEGNDTLVGSKLSDRLDGGGGMDELRGGGGPDVLVPGGGGGTVKGGEGRDRLFMSGDGRWEVSNALVTRSGPADEHTTITSIEVLSLTGGDGKDSMAAAGFSGALVLDGGRGKDELRSGSGRDQLLGRSGNDLLFAGPGKDVLEGGKGDDELHGGDGDDQLRGGPGDDTCTGGAGADATLSC
jgi:Ca2+-binding RTX toxin-like protein